MAFRKVAIVAVVLMFVATGSAQTSAKNCTTAGAKCGLPIVFLGAGASDTANVAAEVFAAVRSANRSLYP